MKPDFFKQLCEIAGKENVRTDEPMKQHTTFRIGGAADYFVSPQTTDQIKNIIDLCKSEAMPWYVIGNGSNLLVSDRGFRGVIIQLFKNFSDLRVEGDRLYVQAGTLLSRTAKKALEASLTGFEFAAGIPGTIGGAMVMNAGAYGGEMKDVTEEVTVLTEKGEVKTCKKRRTEDGIPDKHHCRKRLSCAGSCSAADRRRSKRNPCRDGRSEENSGFPNSRWNIRVPEVRSNVRKDTLPES